MDRQFKVAYLGIVAGDPNAAGYEDMMDRIGLCSFTATADQISDVLNNMGGYNGLDLKQVGITLEKQAMEIFGGRGFGSFTTLESTKEIISEAELLIISSHSQSIFGALLMQQAILDSLPDSSIIVFRLPFAKEEADYYNSNFMTRLRNQMSTNGKKNKQKHKIEKVRIYSIGHESYGGVDPSTSIPQLQSVLYHKEIKEEIIKPIKETTSAGKSIINLGRSFASWVSKLVSSN